MGKIFLIMTFENKTFFRPNQTIVYCFRGLNYFSRKKLNDFFLEDKGGYQKMIFNSSLTREYSERKKQNKTKQK